VLLARHTDPKSLRPNGSLLRDQEIAARNELRHQSCSDRSQGAKWTHVSAKDAPMRGELDLTRLGHSKGTAATLTASLVSPSLVEDIELSQERCILL
jgi:hypothetical protein